MKKMLTNFVSYRTKINKFVFLTEKPNKVLKNQSNDCYIQDTNKTCVVGTTHLCNNFHQICSKLESQIIQKKTKQKKTFTARKPKGLNRIAQIDYGHLCLTE